MEEWLADPVRMQFEEERQSRRASNANSRAASRMQTPSHGLSRHGSVRIPQNYIPQNVVVENASRFPLSNTTLELLTERYFRNLGDGETTYVPVDQSCTTEVILQPVMTDFSDDPVGLFLAAEDDDESSDMRVTDRTFLETLSRSLKMARQCDQNAMDEYAQRLTEKKWPNMIVGPVLSATSKMESQSQRYQSKNGSSERTSITDASLHHNSNPTSTRVPFAKSNGSTKTTMVSDKTEMSKTPAAKKSLWSPRSRGIANDSDPIATYHDKNAPQSKEPTKKPAQSSIGKLTRARGRMFIKSE